MKQILTIFFLFLISITLWAQEEERRSQFRFSGQVSGWAQYAPDIEEQIWLGGRYIPQLNYKTPLKNEQFVDFEASANIFGDLGIVPFDSVTANGKIKPYRIWARYSNTQMEIRLGLQKINFGSAQLFRPLMWFDRMDPRDPLQLTDGVWGGLFRYYFLNNANIWFWALIENSGTKGWEALPTSKHIPEVGGRFQMPITIGEAALSYHFRSADASSFAPFIPNAKQRIGEHRVGLDIKLDLVVGLWAEASWTHLSKNIASFTNQEIVTLGTDYTFGIGNGLAATFEQLVYSNDEKAFRFDNTITLSALSLSYPFTMFDNLSAIAYYDWTNKDFYSFINWQKQFNNLTFYLMGYWNPKQYALPTQPSEANRFAGKGLQFMVVWNY